MNLKENLETKQMKTNVAFRVTHYYEKNPFFCAIKHNKSREKRYSY